MINTSIEMEIREAISESVEFLSEDKARIVSDWLDTLYNIPEPDWDIAPWYDDCYWCVDGISSGPGYCSWWVREKPSPDECDGTWAVVNEIFAGYVDLPVGVDWRTTLRRGKGRQIVHD